MAIGSMVYFRRRASGRMVADLPRDLADMVLDEPLQVIVKVRELIARDQVRDAGKIAPDRKAHWGVPSSPASSRLRSADGLESFHFSRNRTSKRTAYQFDFYSTRQARQAETARQEESSLAPAVDHDLRPASTFDRYVRDHGDDLVNDPFFLTNLDPDPVRRGKQWDHVEQNERGKRDNPDGGPPRINLRFALAPDLLLAAAEQNDCPPGLRDAILAERDRVAGDRALPIRQQRVGKPWVDPGAERAARWLEAQPGWAAWRGQQMRPAKLLSGRGTPIVWAGELELPHVFGPSERHAVLRGLDAFVQAQAAEDIARQRTCDRTSGDAAADTRTWAVPFIAAVHMHGSLNHRYNDHAHLQHGLRLVAIDRQGELRFSEYKVGVMSRMGWDKKLRCEAARLINVHLGALGADFRLSPETYATLGIDASPMAQKVGKGTTSENAGVVVDRALGNHIEGWRRAFAKVEVEHAVGMRALDARDRGYADTIDTFPEKKRARINAECAIARAGEEQALAMSRDAAELELYIAMAASRPERVRTFAKAYADETARKAARETYDATRWRERDRQATAELVRLDGELAEERVAIRTRRREAERLQAEAVVRYAAIDAALAGKPVAEQVAPAQAARALGTHEAVALIKNAPLLVSRHADQYLIRAEDDPRGKVDGVDLSSPEIKRRLAGIQAGQAQELAQLAAYGRKHGVTGLRHLARADQEDGWLARAARRWADTPWLARLEAERRRIDLAAMHRVQLASLTSDDVDYFRPNALRTALPDSVPDLPGGTIPVDRNALARHGVVFAPAAPTELRAPTPDPTRAPAPAALPVPVTPVATRLSKHRRPASSWNQFEKGLQGVTEPYARRFAVVSAPPAPDQEREPDQTLARSVSAIPASAPASTPKPPLPGVSLREIAALATQARAAAEKRARAMLDEQLDRLARVHGSLGPVARTFLINLHAHPEYYQVEAGRLTCKAKGGDRESGFELLMHDPEVASLALVTHAHARADQTATPPSWVIAARADPRYFSTTNWMREASAPCHALVQTLPAILARRPLLSRSPRGLGLADEHVVVAASYATLGLYSRSVQQMLEAAYRIQEEERLDCLARVADGSNEVRLSVVRRPAFKTIVGPAPDGPPLPETFSRFANDAEFLNQCVEARRKRMPGRSKVHSAVRAWVTAQKEGQPDAVLAHIGAFIWDEPNRKVLLREAGPDLAFAIAKSIGRQHELMSMSPRPRERGPRRGVPAR